MRSVALPGDERVTVVVASMLRELQVPASAMGGSAGGARRFSLAVSCGLSDGVRLDSLV